MNENDELLRARERKETISQEIAAITKELYKIERNIENYEGLRNEKADDEELKELETNLENSKASKLKLFMTGLSVALGAVIILNGMVTLTGLLYFLFECQLNPSSVESIIFWLGEGVALVSSTLIGINYAKQKKIDEQEVFEKADKEFNDFILGYKERNLIRTTHKDLLPSNNKEFLDLCDQHGKLKDRLVNLTEEKAGLVYDINRLEYEREKEKGPKLETEKKYYIV
jgi:hypothetical protein